MKTELLELIKSTVRLSEDLYMGGEESECSSRYDTLSRLSQNISNSDAPSTGIIEQIIAAYNSSNFAIYSCVTVQGSNSINQNFECGENLFYDSIKNIEIPSYNNEGIYETLIDIDDKKYSLYIYKKMDNSITITNYTVASSPFFSTEIQIKFTEQLFQLIQKMYGLPDDYLVLNKDLINFLEKQKPEVYLFYYNFKDLYKIFSHLGIDVVEEISEYLYKRLENKYKDQTFIYQLSLEQTLIFFSNEQEDMRINFDFKSIPIPYKMKRMLIKGNSKYDKLLEYLSTE